MFGYFKGKCDTATANRLLLRFVNTHQQHNCYFVTTYLLERCRDIAETSLKLDTQAILELSAPLADISLRRNGRARHKDRAVRQGRVLDYTLAFAARCKRGHGTLR